ncbi:hypothetical protein BRD17_02900 [Halobacteriales archaeon SW_7_68_16]|nr:MAG: hypothetical protein BRD17_02900 [Halobacteriales archaeon SW_7_68_16]
MNTNAHGIVLTVLVRIDVTTIPPNGTMLRAAWDRTKSSSVSTRGEQPRDEPEGTRVYPRRSIRDAFGRPVPKFGFPQLPITVSFIGRSPYGRVDSSARGGLRTRDLRMTQV